MTHPEEILAYWLDEIGPEGWYKGGKALDQQIRDRFEDDWHHAMAGGYAHWQTCPKGALAYIILTDQFSRNMFRDTPDSFASDSLAKAVAKTAIARGWDMRIDGMGRQFFYMPLMHSESLEDQDRAVRLIKERMPDGGAQNLIHARAHREVIRRFGRFPTRNAALSRPSSGPEAAFVEAGGYSRALEAVRA